MFNDVKQRLIRRSRAALLFGFLVLLLFYPNQAAYGDEIAIWNFNDSDLIVDHGTGTLTTNLNSVNVVFAAGTLTNSRLGDVAGQSLSLQGGTGNVNNGRWITISVNTSGRAAIVVSFATQGSSTGFNSNQFQYSLDGVSFVDFASPYKPPSAFGSIPFVFDLSSITGLNNNPQAAFRIVFSGARRLRERTGWTTWLFQHNNCRTDFNLVAGIGFDEFRYGSPRPTEGKNRVRGGNGGMGEPGKRGEF